MPANQTARADWNGPSGQAWVSGADGRDAVLAPVLDVLLEAAAPAPGERVLDVGCGCGATTLAAARAVGADGGALGVDLSEPMLEVARRRARDAALDHVSFTVADAQTDELPTGHDVAISRFGTMFFDDAAAAFGNVARALRPGARLCIATWQPLADNEWLVLPSTALGGFPAATPGGPGMFAQSSADVLVGLLEGAGFGDVDVRPVAVPARLGRDVAEATDYLASLGMARNVLAALEPPERDAALATLRAAVAERADADGVTLGSGILVTTATRLDGA